MHGKGIISEKCGVTFNRKIEDTNGTYVLRIKNQFIASNYKPGQFVMIKPNSGAPAPLLARPFSVFNKFNDCEFEILYRVCGSSTEILSKIPEGGFLDVTGPLGNGFNLELDANADSGKRRTHILIAGGVGLAPLFSMPDYIANVCGNAGKIKDRIILYYGAGKAEELYFRRNLTDMAQSGLDEVHFATDDGSFGFKGNIIELLDKNIGEYVKKDGEAVNRNEGDGVFFYACGPKTMTNGLISRFLETGLPPDSLQVSLEESFGCGIGVCLGCAIKIKKAEDFEYKRVCKDGPVFYAGEIFDINDRNIVRGEPVNIDVNDNDKDENNKNKNKDINLSVKLRGLFLDYPVMPASGTFGYGEEFINILDYEYFGALVTKGISLEPSKGNEMPRICETSCGMINSIGLQNVGLEKFRNDKMPFLRNFKKPVIVNFFGKSIEEYVLLAQKLSEIEGIGALEANISCPNIKEGGRTFGSDPEAVYELVSSVKEITGDKLPLIVKLTPMVSDISLIAEVCEKAGADIISLINTIPAAKIDIKTKKFKLGRGFGGLSGAAIKPVAIKLVNDVYNSVRIPIIGMGGISSWEDAAEFFLAGASAVSVGTYSFVKPKIVPEIVCGLKNYLIINGFDSIYRIIGLANRKIKP